MAQDDGCNFDCDNCEEDSDDCEINIDKLKAKATQGDAEAANQLGIIYDRGFKDGADKLEDWLCSDEVREFERKHKATHQQERDLLFCSVLMTQNWEPAIVLPMLKNLDLATDVLEGWGISDHERALFTLGYLSVADNHTGRVNAEYEKINAELNPYRPSNDFKTAKQMLMRFGYSEKELNTLPTLAAWDYGRCGFIARFAAHVGYIDENTAWHYIHEAAENAAQHYDSWRQYLAAYVLGRALWGSDCVDMEKYLAYLLCSQNSPFKRGIGIKAGCKEKAFIFLYISKSIEPSSKESAKWYQLAAELGHVDAQCSIGYCYDVGCGVEEAKHKAVYWYRKAAEQGYETAQYNLGVTYANGDGVIQNYREAAKWYQLAAEQNNISAINNLAVLYEEGLGLPQSYENAAALYKQAAELGDAAAQYNLADMYECGKGVITNIREAMKWYRKAAEQGDADAQYDLGEAYATGEGVEMNIKEAEIWYAKAAEQGHDDAQEALNALRAYSAKQPHLRLVKNDDE